MNKIIAIFTTIGAAGLLAACASQQSAPAPRYYAPAPTYHKHYRVIPHHGKGKNLRQEVYQRYEEQDQRDNDLSDRLDNLQNTVDQLRQDSVPPK